MSCTIGCLVTLGLQVSEPLLWQRQYEAGIFGDMDLICPVNRAVAMHDIEEELVQQYRRQVSEHEANAGLERRWPPCPNSTKKLYRTLSAEGKCTQARALQAIFTHIAWGRPEPPQILTN